MSANNVIYVQRIGDSFFVWHTDIDSPRSAHMGDVVDADILEEAVTIAQKMAFDYSYVEYGIQVLPESQEEDE